MRFSKVITGTLFAGSAGALTAYEKARSSFAPQPPQPDFGSVVEWVATGNDMVALGAIALAAISMGYSIYQMFRPDPATPKDVTKDGRKTRVGIEHISRQSAAETNALMARIDEMEARLLTQNPAGAQQIEGFVTTATGLAESGNAEDVAIAREAVEGDPIEAGEQLLAKVEADVADAAERARQAARIFAPFSITKAITAYARAVELDPAHFGTWIELSRLHQAAGSLPQARRTAEAALQHVRGDWDRMVAEGTLGDIALAEGQLPSATRHYQSALSAAQARLVIDPHDNDRLHDLSVSHNKLGNVAGAAGDLAGARQSYAASLAIAERLAASDPGNAGWQRDLSVGHNKLGDVARDRAIWRARGRAMRQALRSANASPRQTPAMQSGSVICQSAIASSAMLRGLRAIWRGRSRVMRLSLRPLNASPRQTPAMRRGSVICLLVTQNSPNLTKRRAMLPGRCVNLKRRRRS